MKKALVAWKIVVVVMAVALLVPLLAVGQLAPKVTSNSPSLRELAEGAHILIGYASRNDFWALPDAKKYMDIAKREFNILTPENQMKWDTIHPQTNSYNFGPADKHVEFALKNGIVVHGHTLVWHNQLPAWLTARKWRKQELEKVLEEHITKVVGHFRGKVSIWDVVNEALNEDGSYRQSIWYNVIGPEYIEKAFIWAHEADPDAILIYNDYNIETINAKSDALYKMVVGFKKKGIPIDGIGFQMHITEEGIDYDSFAKNLERFAALGLKLYITEMDVRIPAQPTMEDLLKQAEVYGRILQICLAEPAVKAVQFWGFTDKYSWIPSFFPGKGSALLFDEEYNPKPAYYALKEVLSAFIANFREYKALKVEKVTSEDYKIEVTVQNVGGKEETKKVGLLVNGEVVATKEITLEPREEKTIGFEHRFNRSGTYSVSIGNLSPVKIKIPGGLTLLQPSVWMDFEGNFGNLSPSGVKAKPSGKVMFAEGEIGKAIEMHGNGRVELVDPVYQRTGGKKMSIIPYEGTFTISFWFKPEPSEENWGPFALFDASKNPKYFFVSVTDHSISWSYEDAFDSDFQSEAEYKFEKGKWYHVAVTGGFGQSVAKKIYVNGKEIASTNISPTVRGNLSQPVIGADSDPTYYPALTGFEGAIDEIRVFPRILSAEEIRALAETHEFVPGKGIHTTEWRELSEGVTIKALTAKASLGGTDKVEAVVETSNDKKNIIDSVSLILKDGKWTYPLTLKPAKYFRIKTILTGFRPLVDDYEVELSNGSVIIWSTVDDWAKGTRTENVYLAAVTAPAVAFPAEVGFEDKDTKGWRARGEGVKVSITDEVAHSGKYSLYVKGRSAGWHGTEMDLLKLVKPGRTYEFSVWVYQKSGKSQKMILTVQRVFGSEPRGWDRVAEVTAESGKWVELKGTYTVPGNTAIKELILYVESENPTLEFYIDDSRVVEK